MSKHLPIILSSIFVFIFLFAPNFTEATSTKNLKDAFKLNLKTTAGEASYNITDDDQGSLLTKNINTIINIALSLIGVIFVILTVYGGFLYMTARGNEEKTKKGLSIVVQALIGLVVVLAAYAISFFVFKYFI